MATHALVYFTQQHQIPVDIFYTFGSPRVGDVNFVSFMSGLFSGLKVRVTHGRDPVPHLLADE
jgi:hypothetical protein